MVAAAATAGCDGFLELETEFAAYYVLLDISRSYFRHTQAALVDLREVVRSLRRRDQFTVCKIESCSFSQDAQMLSRRMPDEETPLQAARVQLYDEMRTVWGTLEPSGFTDISSAMLRATQRLNAARADHRIAIVFSDLVETRSQNCVAPSDDEIDLTGVNLIFARFVITGSDTSRPRAWAERWNQWKSWAIDRGAASVELADDGVSLRARVFDLQGRADEEF